MTLSARHQAASLTVVALTGALLAPLGTASARQPTDPDLDLDLIRVRGTVLVLPGEGGGVDRYSLRLRSGGIVALAEGFSAAPLSRFSGTVSVPGTTGGLTLTGARRSSTLRRVVDARTPLAVVSSRVAAAAPSPGPVAHTTYVAKVTNFGAIGLTDAQILATVQGAQAYWVRESAGMIPSWSTASAVVPVASGAGSAAGGCGLGNGGADFDAIADNVAAQAYPGVDFSGASPNHLVVVVPDACGGTVSGRGRRGTSFGSGGPVIIDARAQPQPTLEHEFGHNVGLQHANNTAAEYGDLYEVMGAGPDAFPHPVLGTVYRWEQGILAPGEIVDGTGGGSWTLAPRSAGSGLRSVVFIDPDDGRRHFVDLRDGSAADAGTYYTAGATTPAYGQLYRPGITVQRENEKSGAVLQPAPGNDGALQGGETWSNASGTLRVTGNGATVTAVRNTSVPTVSGGAATISSPVALREVTAGASGFSPAADGYRYQWLVNGQPIAHAEDSTFAPTAAMAGGRLSVRVTGYAHGTNPSPAVESAAQTVAPAAWYARGTRRYPEISGTTRVGQTLTAHGLDWVGYDGLKPADFSTAHRWARNGNPIAGATASTYRLTAKDLGKRIQVTEYPRGTGYDTTELARSYTTEKVRIGRLTTTRPRIGGTAKVGTRVVARPRGWTNGTRFRYRWFVGTRAIRSATSKKLRVTRSMRGKKLVVRVTGKKAGYQKATVRSRPKKVR